jgi:hypothetical protein
MVSKWARINLQLPGIVYFSEWHEKTRHGVDLDAGYPREIQDGRGSFDARRLVRGLDHCNSSMTASTGCLDEWLFHSP